MYVERAFVKYNVNIPGRKNLGQDLYAPTTIRNSRKFV